MLHQLTKIFSLIHTTSFLFNWMGDRSSQSRLYQVKLCRLRRVVEVDSKRDRLGSSSREICDAGELVDRHSWRQIFAANFDFGQVILAKIVENNLEGNRTLIVTQALDSPTLL